jgi:hypothetical protein
MSAIALDAALLLVDGLDRSGFDTDRTLLEAAARVAQRALEQVDAWRAPDADQLAIGVNKPELGHSIGALLIAVCDVLEIRWTALGLDEQIELAKRLVSP